jgi:hypothetical protein
MAGQTEQAITARNEALSRMDVTSSGRQEGTPSCVDKLMAAGRTRDEAEKLCGEHQKNLAEAKKRDSVLGKLLSSVGK